MAPAKQSTDEKLHPGLCSDCLNARRIESPHGSVFLLCYLSVSDARFPKYPRLPVLSCDGYKPKKVEPASQLSP
jgi:hypothetical protein